MKKKLKIGRAKGARQLFRAKGEARSPKVGGLGEAQRRAHEPKGEHHNSKAKAQISGLKRKTSLTTKETKGAQNKHQERGDPPLQGNTEASKGFELWPPPVLGR